MNKKIMKQVPLRTITSLFIASSLLSPISAWSMQTPITQQVEDHREVSMISSNVDTPVLSNLDFTIDPYTRIMTGWAPTTHPEDGFMFTLKNGTYEYYDLRVSKTYGKDLAYWSTNTGVVTKHFIQKIVAPEKGKIKFSFTVRKLTPSYNAEFSVQFINRDYQIFPGLEGKGYVNKSLDYIDQHVVIEVDAEAFHSQPGQVPYIDISSKANGGIILLSDLAVEYEGDEADTRRLVQELFRSLL
ncbi:TPA: hypothetical protein ACHU8X_002649, partial [Enterococcus faecalis]